MTVVATPAAQPADRNLLVPTDEFPGLRGAIFGEQYASHVLQVIRLLRRSVAVKKARRGYELESRLCQRLIDDVDVRSRSDLDCHIVGVFDEIHFAAVEIELDLETRVVGQEIGDGGNDVKLTEQVRRADLEHARRPLLVLGDGLLDLGQILDDLLAPVVVEIAELGQRQLTSRSM